MSTGNPIFKASETNRSWLKMKELLEIELSKYLLGKQSARWGSKTDVPLIIAVVSGNQRHCEKTIRLSYIAKHDIMGTLMSENML
tara:strand:+ start:761 stop:1015 length:255 start_codon:yes stop_codon:yes gene_type:complete